MHWRDVPEFYQSLNYGRPVQLALQLLILTAARSRPLRYLHVDHIDGEVWTIPSELQKGRKDKSEDFRIPLSDEAQSVILEVSQFACDGLIFP